MFGNKSEPSQRWVFDIIENKQIKFIGEEYVFDQLKQANWLRNAYIATRRDELNELDNLRKQISPEYQSLLDSIKEIDNKINEIYNDIKSTNIENRIRSTGTEEQKNTILKLKENKKILYNNLKKIKTICTTNLKNNGELEKLNISYHARELDVYNESKMYFGTKIRIRDTRDKKHFPQWSKFNDRSSHEFSIQYQKHINEPLWTWEQLKKKKHIIEKLIQVPIFDKNGTQINFKDKVYTVFKRKLQGIEIEIPFILDRAIPEDCIIKWVHIIYKKRANRYDKEIQFIISNSIGFKKTNLATSGHLGVDTNWEKISDNLMENGLLVAVCIGDNKREHNLIIPKKYVDYYLKSRDLHGIRDKEFNKIMDIFSIWTHLNSQSSPEWLVKDLSNMYQWKSPNSLSRLVRKWYFNRFDGDSGIFKELKDWLSQDQHLHSWEVDGRKKFLIYREVLYRNFWKEMSKIYRVCGIEKLQISKMKRKVNPEFEDIPAVRYYRDIVSPGLFLELGKEAMSKTILVEAKNSSKKCSFCHKICNLQNAKEYTCEHCGQHWNRHVNAAHNIRQECIKICERLNDEKLVMTTNSPQTHILQRHMKENLKLV